MRPAVMRPAGSRVAVPSSGTCTGSFPLGTSGRLPVLAPWHRASIRTGSANYNGSSNYNYTVTTEPLTSPLASTASSDEEDYYSLARRFHSPDPQAVDLLLRDITNTPAVNPVTGDPLAAARIPPTNGQTPVAPAPATASTPTPAPTPGTTPGAPAAAPAVDPVAFASVDISDYPGSFPMRRLFCFIGITAGYMGLYFTRGSLTYCSPVLLADPQLGMTITDLGVMTSAFPLAYGFSKFAGGVLGAKYSNRLMLGGGLLMTALINLVFGMSASVTAFTALWFLNGSIQGIGAPASASLLTKWFGSKERGTYWGLWNIGANLGGFLTPLVVGWMANHYGWRAGMWVPGAIGLSVALFVLATVRDSPLAAGYTPNSAAASAVPQQPLPPSVAASKAKQSKPNTMRAALETVVRNPGVWLLALSYFFVYIVRQGATSWLMMYLMQQKGAANAAQAAFTVSGLEVGGLVGGTLAGILSDARLRGAQNKEKEQGVSSGMVGQRVQIVMGYIVCMLGALVGLKFVPASSQVLQWLCIAALGFTIYGPHMLIGLCGAELVTKSAVGASQGVLGLVAYMGAANAGIPLSYVLKNYSWDGYFAVMAAACVAALALLAPLANAQSFTQIQRAQRAQKLA